ncbi:MAG: S-layer homology domain-containing protein, partial [Oscillospiraceae bacterium]|nr:S-layer homology domain-containing protein [Oscillospiraceae bacterium]
SPESTMTRAMLMTVLARYAGVDTSGGSTWYEKGMNWAKENGVSDGTNPSGNITREQLATMLYRYAQKQGKGFTGAWAFLLDYPDRESVSDWAYEAMCWMTMNKVINGMGDGTLNPKGSATRAQVATMLMRFVELG